MRAINIRKVAVVLSVVVLSVIAVSTFLIYELYSYHFDVTIYQSVSREIWIPKDNATEVAKELMQKMGIEHYYYNETSDSWNKTHVRIDWWEYQGFHIEQRFPYREDAFWLWGLEIFALILFSVTRMMRQTPKSVSMNSQLFP